MIGDISNRLVVVAVVISTFLCTVISVGHAQTDPFKSPLTVRVFDEKGAAIAKCVLLFRSDSEVIASHTEADGSLTLSLRSGKYSVTASKAGFVRTNLEVQVPIAEALRVVMKVDMVGDGVIVDGPFMDLNEKELNNADFRVPMRMRAPKKRAWQCLYLWKCSTA